MSMLTLPESLHVFTGQETNLDLLAMGAMASAASYDASMKRGMDAREPSLGLASLDRGGGGGSASSSYRSSDGALSKQDVLLMAAFERRDRSANRDLYDMGSNERQQLLGGGHPSPYPHKRSYSLTEVEEAGRMGTNNIPPFYRREMEVDPFSSSPYPPPSSHTSRAAMSVPPYPMDNWLDHHRGGGRSTTDGYSRYREEE